MAAKLPFTLLSCCILLINTHAQSNFKFFISKNEINISKEDKHKLTEEFGKLDPDSNPNIIFPKVAENIYTPPAGKQYSFFIIHQGKGMCKYTISRDGIKKDEQLLSLFVRGSNMEFWNLSDFDSFFRDTIVVIDTLSLDFSKLNELSNDEIRISINGKIFSDFKNDYPIMICAGCFGVDPGLYYSISLQSDYLKSKIYSAKLFLIGSVQEEELIDFIKTLKEKRNNIDEAELVQITQSYISLQWGKCQPVALRSWLINNKIN